MFSFNPCGGCRLRTLKRRSEMERLFLVGTTISLAASWIYIFLLRARISECMRYIQKRIERASPVRWSGDSSAGEEGEAEYTGNPPPSQLDGAISSLLGRATTAERPQPIVEILGNHSSFYYRCSDCSRIFLLPEDRPPKEAARELFRSFGEHVEEEHSLLHSVADQRERRPLEA
jgi:hypothetical protein